MKLNAAEIREIEKFLTAREKGMNNGAIGAYFGLGDHASQKASVAFTVLSKIGVRVADTPKKRGGIPSHRAPRRAHGVAKATACARLTAEQWQERLSAHGF